MLSADLADGLKNEKDRQKRLNLLDRLLSAAIQDYRRIWRPVAQRYRLFCGVCGSCQIAVATRMVPATAPTVIAF